MIDGESSDEEVDKGNTEPGESYADLDALTLAYPDLQVQNEVVRLTGMRKKNSLEVKDKKVAVYFRDGWAMCHY